MSDVENTQQCDSGVEGSGEASDWQRLGVSAQALLSALQQVAGGRLALIGAQWRLSLVAISLSLVMLVSLGCVIALSWFAISLGAGFAIWKFLDHWLWALFVVLCMQLLAVFLLWKQSRRLLQLISIDLNIFESEASGAGSPAKE
ncbi:hypothetical protein ACCI51_08940 [Microbulbifer echini]|uniref:Holin-X, holin superfamily III n=1 Tax=Microbulbifer echini TaxID=1529067 RepID=A0ABV4NMB0_9GAMM|nr:hypothetical protein [uncultured Microbulbifer sp.]